MVDIIAKQFINLAVLTITFTNIHIHTQTGLKFFLLPLLPNIYSLQALCLLAAVADTKYNHNIIYTSHPHITLKAAHTQDRGLD